MKSNKHFECRKILSVAAFTVMASTGLAARIYVSVDGQNVEFPYAQPQMIGDHVMVPLRGVFERMGASVDWHPSQQEVLARKGDVQIELRVNNNQAYVNGRAIPIDASPVVTQGTTLVPIRFVSESLGANVDWNESTNTVYISTNGSSISPTPRRDYGNRTDQPVRAMTLSVQPKGSVLPVKLDSSIRSQDAQVGDRFTATIDTNGGNDYYGLPQGTKVGGYVSFAQPQSGTNPGVLGLSFDQIMTTDGRKIPIQASLIGLDNQNVTNDNGRLMASNRASQKDDMKYVGTGAGAGVIVALLTHKNIVTSGVIGGALGYLYQQLSAKDRAKNVVLDRGTPIGVRFDQEARVRVYQN